MRASAFARSAGSPRSRPGEEHALLDRLRLAGFALVTGAGITVRTSARTDGRAAGGLADLLRRGGAGEQAPRTAVPGAEGG